MNEDTTRRQRENGDGYANVDQNIYLLSSSRLLNLLFISYYFSFIRSHAYVLFRSLYRTLSITHKWDKLG